MSYKSFYSLRLVSALCDYPSQKRSGVDAILSEPGLASSDAPEWKREPLQRAGLASWGPALKPVSFITLVDTNRVSCNRFVALLAPFPVV